MPSSFVSRQDLFAVGRAAIVATPGIRINPTMIDVPGSDLNLTVGVDAVLGEEISMRSAYAMRGAFAELARGSQLDRVIYDRSGLLRFGATPASVDLVLSRPTATGGAGTLDAGSVVQTAAGTQFGLDYAVVFGDALLTTTASATSTTSGADTNVAAGTVTGFSTQPFDTTLTVTNPTSAAGGTDAEDAIAFLGRYRGYFPTLSRGTLGAIEYGATQVPGVAVATATEVVNPGTGYPAAIVQLVIGDVSGNATFDMVKAVANMMLTYRALGIYVQVLSGVVFQQAVAWSLAFQTGVNEALAVSRVRAVTVACAQFLAPGATLYRSTLISAARKVPGVIISDSSLVYPLGDVEPTSVQQMIRVASQAVTFQ